MSFLGPVARVLAAPTLLRLGLILLMVEAVFVAESFTGMMEQALRYGGSAQDVLKLLVYRMPEILDLALALGMLIAVYFAISEARRRGELIILATAGVNWRRLTAFTFSIGALGGAISIVIAGFLVPAARYGERIKVAELRADHVVDQVLRPGPRSTVQTLAGSTFVATEPEGADQQRGQLFIFQPRGPDGWRASLSHDWTINGPNDEGIHDVGLSSFRAYEGDPKLKTEPERPINVISAGNAKFDFRLDKIVPQPDRTQREDETPVRLFKLSDDNARKRAGEITARGLLVPMAALLALATALAGGGGIGRYFALPCAIILLMVYDVLGRAVVGEAAQSLPLPGLAVAAALAYILPPLAYVLWRGETVMTPVRGSL